MTSALWTHLVKDLRIEWRSREAVNSMQVAHLKREMRLRVRRSHDTQDYCLA